MTDQDILLERVFHITGTSESGTSLRDLWRVTVAGKQPSELHAFPAAVDVALVWAQESGGRIFLVREHGKDPELYEPST